MSLLESLSKLRSFESFVCPGGNYPGGKCLDENRPERNVRVGIFLGGKCPGGTARGGTVLVGMLSGGNCPGGIVREEVS